MTGRVTFLGKQHPPGGTFTVQQIWNLRNYNTKKLCLTDHSMLSSSLAIEHHALTPFPYHMSLSSILVTIHINYLTGSKCPAFLKQHLDSSLLGQAKSFWMPTSEWQYVTCNFTILVIILYISCWYIWLWVLWSCRQCLSDAYLSIL